MVDIGAQQTGSSTLSGGLPAISRATDQVAGGQRTRRPTLRRRFWLSLAAVVALAGLALALPQATAAPAAASPAAGAAGHRTSTTTAPPAPSTTTPAVTTPPTPTTSVAVPAPVAAPAASPSVAALVAEVEAAGIVPSSTWSWSMGDTAASCGVTSSPGSAAGCTSWSSGNVRTVFAGSPPLALVAHEVANAEVEQYAIPSLLAEVSAAAAGTSWSPTDAVASCLVAHFLGFQDGVAGSWQCPVALAASVAAHIHDTVVTNQITAVCGTASGTASTLTFTASSGTLTVTTPSSTLTAAAGVPVTVSGVGTFTAKDVGGTPTVAGTCLG